MRKLFWLITGVALGFVAAHMVNQTPGGSRFFDRVNRGVAEFNRAMSAGYHEAEVNEAELAHKISARSEHS